MNISCEMIAKTDVGRQRSRNEDSHLVFPEFNLICVADGMGGHVDGDVASRTAVETLKEMYEKFHQEKISGRNMSEEESLSAQTAFLKECIEQANGNIFNRNQNSFSMDGMGTTIVALQLSNNHAIAAWVGDSRIYRFRQKKLTQLTQDHSLVEQLVRYNIITEKDAIFMQNKNIITRALGMAQTVVVDTNQHVLEPDDIFILCSDGITDHIPDANIEKICCDLKNDLPKMADYFIDQANEAGGHDNITIALVKICNK